MYIYLDILPRFKCAMCGACCRREWLVTVDEAGYRRNGELFSRLGRDEEYRTAFLPLGDFAAAGEYAAIAKRPAGGCWFLKDNNLCRLQLAAGHEHLDGVCRLFPRYPMNTSRGVEITLSFSCPEVLRLIERPEPLAVVRAEEPPTAVEADSFTAEVFPGQRPRYTPLFYYFELEHHFIDIVQSRGLPLAARLRLLAGTADALSRLPPDESSGRAIDRIVADNYARLDAAATGGPPDRPPAEVLLEHFFVNLIFKKIFYLYGLERATLLLAEMWQRFAAARGRAAGPADDLAITRAAVMALEFEYCHDRQALFRGRKAPGS